MQHFDILSIGDVVTDAFIRLLDKEAQVIKDDQGGRWLALPYPTKIPFDKSEVVRGAGNAANAAVSFGRLGLKTALVTNVGNDSEGRDIITALHANKVDPRFIRINPGKRSNYNYVLWYGDDRTILVHHEQYEYDWPRLAKKDVPRWVYFSSLSKNSLEYHDEIADWLDEHPHVHLAFQPGTFQIETGAKRLSRLYKRASIVLVNREEAVKVGGGKHEDMHDLLDNMHELGPQVVIITDGPKGAYGSDGRQRLKMPPYPDPAPPVERNGAGDAFSSAFVAAAAKGLSLEDALRWAPINSMSVVQHVGSQAGLLTERELLQYLHKTPKNYHAKPF